MRILVLSDTHVSSGMGRLPGKVYDALKDADLVIHAGDIVTMDVIDELAAEAPVEAVSGNMDGFDVSGKLPGKRVVLADGYRIGVTHGAGPVSSIERRVMDIFRDDNVDCIVFGHSHAALVKHVDGILLVNPGSPTDRHWARFNSFAVIETKPELRADIIEV